MSTTPTTADAPATAERPPAPTFQNGDLVRFLSGGAPFLLDDVNPNPNFREADEYFASGMSDHGTQHVTAPEDIELVMTAADAKARTLPTIEQIAKQIGHSIHSPISEVAVDVTETEEDEPGVVLAFGRASNGLPVAFKVTISDVTSADGLV